MKTVATLVSVALASLNALAAQPITETTDSRGVQISSEVFPDQVLREYVSANFDLDEDGYLSDDEIAVAKVVSLGGSMLENLDGIEHLSNLESLCVYSCKLDKIDVSSCANLTYLDCSGNNLTSLNLSSNKELVSLYCYSNKIKSLDLSSNVSLVTLNCEKNDLESLDVSNNVGLAALYCLSNHLVNLDLSKNASLSTLDCRKNNIQGLNLSEKADVQIRR